MIAWSFSLALTTRIVNCTKIENIIQLFLQLNIYNTKRQHSSQYLFCYNMIKVLLLLLNKLPFFPYRIRKKINSFILIFCALKEKEICFTNKQCTWGRSFSFLSRFLSQFVVLKHFPANLQHSIRLIFKYRK